MIIITSNGQPIQQELEEKKKREKRQQFDVSENSIFSGGGREQLCCLLSALCYKYTKQFSAKFLLRFQILCLNFRVCAIIFIGKKKSNRKFFK